MKNYTCEKCGGNTFWLFEEYGWSCDVQEDGELCCSFKSNETMTISCKKCGDEREYKDFKGVTFN